MINLFFFYLPQIELSFLGKLFGFSVGSLGTILIVFLHLVLGAIQLTISVGIVYLFYLLLRWIWTKKLHGTFAYNELNPILEGVDWKLLLLVALGCDFITEYWQIFSPMVRRSHFVEEVTRLLFGEVTGELKSLTRILNFYWISIIFYMVLPLLFLIGRDIKTGDNFYRSYTFTLGKWKVGLALTGLCWLVMLVVLFIAFGLDSNLRNTYPVAGNIVVKNIGIFILYQTMSLVYLISFEFYFRGMYYFEFERKIGDYAILIMLIPYIIHKFGKPTIEIMSAIIAGTAMSMMSRWTRTFIYGALLHFIVALSADVIAVMYQEGILTPFN